VGLGHGASAKVEQGGSSPSFTHGWNVILAAASRERAASMRARVPMRVRAEPPPPATPSKRRLISGTLAHAGASFQLSAHAGSLEVQEGFARGVYGSFEPTDTALADDGNRPGMTSAAHFYRRQSMVKLHTSLGVITLELEETKAPETVRNFLEYVNSGHYANTVFHRVIDGFMIQGGGLEPGMKQKPTRPAIKNEADNGLKNLAYTIAMARTPDPHSASSQFFINVADNDFLDFRAPTPQEYGYCVFGRVVEGRDVVDQIKKVPTGSKGFHRDVPVEDVVIKKAEVV
jgi:peptidyl-prolyl cis-trans isomerase B (cyclophilin B)